MFLCHVAFRDRDEAGQPRFRSQQIVKGVVVPPFGSIEPDRENLAFLIEQKLEIHFVDKALAGMRDLGQT